MSKAILKVQDDMTFLIKYKENPKKGQGDKKVSIADVPLTVLLEIALGMHEGGRKYGRHNYRHSNIIASDYIGATFRHLAAWWEGEDIDPSSNLSHISKAIASLVVLRDSMINELYVDDRPPKAPAGWMEKLNEAKLKLIEMYPDPRPPHTEKEIKI